MTDEEPTKAEAGYLEDEGVQLMLAWQAGQEAAFPALVEAYSGRVYALLTRFLGPVSNREDLVQDVFLRVLRARERYTPTARFSTWVYRITFNLATNERARGATRATLSLDRGADGDEDGMTLGESVEDFRLGTPEDELARGDVVHAVRAAIDQLPEKQRLALILAKYDELPYVEIAEVLESSEKAIKSMVHRARETLRGVLAPFLREEVA
jgi:RNA polymerase sigma-70 factor (ECF subfamily)